MATQSTEEAYDELLSRIKKRANIGHAQGVLGWDQQVMMPEGGAPARSKQISTLSSISHEILTDERSGELLDQLDNADLNEEQRAIVREFRRQYDRAVSVPQELVEEISETSSDAQQIWQDAKQNDDFEHFAPTLETLIELHTERAEHIDSDRDPYVVMYEDGSPYLPLSRVETIFDELREGLVPLIEEIKEDGDELASPFEDKSFDEDAQMELAKDTLDYLGYDWDHGRLDTSPHPFTSGNQYDARVTTRFNEDEPLGSLMATIHEYGHATYQLGLSKDDYATPLGQPRSSGVHESQSRFWENHIGRTKAFWETFLPTMKEHFPQMEGITPQEVYEAANQIYPNNKIRVEADELTYHMHIILRDEIEREFINGDLEVAEIPEAWNNKMEKYLGTRPETDSKGCLQDIHWTGGFGGFQGYTVGSVLAAQLHHAIQKDLDLEGMIQDGEFEPLREWMGERIHQHGQKYKTDELIERATGEPLTATYFLDYAEDKFRDLYGI